MNGLRNLPRDFLIGAVVAALCLFPLLNALSAAPVWLHWTWRDSMDTLAGWAVGAGVIAMTLVIAFAVRGRLVRDAVIGCWLLVSAMLVCGAIVKIGKLAAFLGAHRAGGSALVAACGLLLAAGAIFLVRHPGAASRLETIVVRLWPAVLLLFFNLARAPGLATAQTGLRSPAPAQVSAPGTIPLATPSPQRTVVLLFDEMSPDYLYGSRAIDLSAYPALRQLRDDGEVHAEANLRGGGTEYAIPALFAATPSARKGLVPTLRAQGRSVRVFGWYHDYCAGMAAAADSCRAISIYNARTLHGVPPIIAPWWTNLNLLPAVFPFSLAKNPAAVAMHRRTLEETRAWLSSQLKDPTADVIYAHVNVPHVPFLEPTTPEDAAHPFTMTESGYLSQFKAIDQIVSDVVHSSTRPTQLIVLSDHNARALLPTPMHTHVVFIRWRSWAAGVPSVQRSEDAAELVGRLGLAPDRP